jgi:exosortase
MRKISIDSAASAFLMLTVCVVFASVASEIVGDWRRDANYSHGFLIPLVSAYTLWQKKSVLRNTRRSPSLWGLAGLIGALCLFVVGTAAAEVFTQRVSFLILCGSLVCFLFGWRHLRLVVFPIVFLTLAIPLPYVIYYGITMPMQALAAKIAAGGLMVIGIPAMVQGNMIHLAGGVSLEVAEACSGIRSLYAFLAVGALMAYSLRIAWWGRLVVFATAIPLTIAGNAFRVFGSGVAASFFGMEATRGAIHETFGLVVFVVTLSLFYAVQKVAQSIWSHGTSQPSSSSASPASTPPNSGMAPRP